MNHPQCTQCGACLDACPVFRLRNAEEVSPKAKQELMAVGWRDDSDLDWQRMLDLAGQCAGCGRCGQVCPRGLSVPDTLSRARARHPRWPQYFWREWISRGKLLWKATAHVAPLVPGAVLPRRMGILHAAALAMKAPARSPVWLQLSPSTPLVAAGQTLAIFGGCTATRLRPLWLRKTRQTLETLGGHVVAAPGFGCCGGTYEHAGMIESALSAARRNLSCWLDLGKPRVVTLCASCLHGLRQYAELEGLLPDTPNREALLRDWLACLTPLSALLATAQVEPTSDAPSAYAYHSPCHWDGHDADLRWLRSVLPGMRQGTALCCGFGGVLQLLQPELSQELAHVCWQGLQPSAPQTACATASDVLALTGCSGCALHLGAHAPQGFTMAHWLDIWKG